MPRSSPSLHYFGTVDFSAPDCGLLAAIADYEGWMREKTGEGWSYGPRPDGKAKIPSFEHPPRGGVGGGKGKRPQRVAELSRSAPDGRTGTSAEPLWTDELIAPSGDIDLSLRAKVFRRKRCHWIPHQQRILPAESRATRNMPAGRAGRLKKILLIREMGTLRPGSIPR